MSLEVLRGVERSGRAFPLQAVTFGFMQEPLTGS